MVTADEAYRTGLVNHVVQVNFWNSVMEWHKMRNSPLAISKAIKSINANYKDGENGFETEIKSFGNVLEQSILKKELQPFREKKSSIYGRIKHSVKLRI
jgi:enoyl-CoA hydratase